MSPSPRTTADAPASRSSNPWFAVSMGLIGIIVGYGLGSSMTPGVTTANVLPTQQQQQPDTIAEEPAGTPPQINVGPVLGQADAPVTIVEFTDFECPFCSRHFTQTFPQIKTAYIDTGKVKYESRHFPLTSLHPNAMLASEAAVCADRQGKFWEMHDKLFVDQQAWSNAADPAATFKGFASELGLSAATFASCLDSHEAQPVVQDDLSAGGNAGVSGTPGFWIIGPDNQSQYISGAYPFSAFQEAVDGMLQ